MTLVEGVRGFWKDLCDVRLCIIKVIYFTLLAGVVILWPQFTIHQQELGLTKRQTGICSSVISAVTILVPLVAGVVGDKLGNYKIVMSMSMVVAAITTFLFTVVPSAKTTDGTDFMNETATTFEIDPERQMVTFWSYLAVRVTFGMIFYISAALHFVTAALMLLLNMNFKLPTQFLTQEILRQLCNSEVIMFLATILAAGMFIGYLETFMYRFLFDLGASKVLIGLTVTVGAPFELVFNIITSYFVGLVGHPPLIAVGLFAYAVRLIGYSLLMDPWWALPLEVLESVANGLLFTAAIMYCTVLFSIESIASFRGVFGVMYFGVGKLLGTTIGSEIRELLGDRITFRVLAAAALLCSVAYCLALLILRRHRAKTLKLIPCPPDSIQQAAIHGIDNRAWEGGSE
ncbi:major facilitator superfamily domain-containing protein 6-A-like isoform X2 [Panulirus ornatus]|uniref:major facilitator superfamily domain-containing protein 6-A-like isoform X2 n=1 Tax=Panulirus ornatus TaxID=150431 RepID=UPI003A89901E